MKEDDISAKAIDASAPNSLGSGSCPAINRVANVRPDSDNAVKDGQNILHEVRGVLSRHGVPTEVAIVILGTIALGI